MKTLGIGLAIILALAGCSATTQISANPAKDVVAGSDLLKPGNLGGVIIQGLQDATWNLDQAVVVGALKPDDPAPKCFHGVLTQLGLDPAQAGTPAPSFVPKVSDLISGGSVLYIRARQLQAAQGQGVAVPGGCKELIAQFLLDAAAAGAKGFPGGGFGIPFR